MSRPPAIRAYLDADEIVVDNFAGGGGASTGIVAAIGREPDYAINHDAEALALHEANHPSTVHLREDVFKVDPVELCAGRRVGLAWFSPDCTHFSKAKGGKPVARKRRGLAWVVVRWATLVKPRVIALENVEEFTTWGPLGSDGRPDRARMGRTFRAWVAKLRKLGYEVAWRELVACDYGSPTKRKRLFLVARCDGRPIEWPTPTHGRGRPRAWRTAAECIDWSDLGKSIFDRKRPLAEATCRRIAHGFHKFVLGAREPFIIPVKSWGGGGNGPGSVHEPLRTITTSKRGEFAVVAPNNVGTRADEPLSTTLTGNHHLVAPTLVQTGYGERDGQVAGGSKHALVAAFLAKHYGGPSGHQTPGAQLGLPMDTVTTQDHHALVAANLVKLYGTCEHGADVRDPMPTVTATGNHIAAVAAFMVAYYGTAKDGGSLFDPLRTVTTKDRLALVTVLIAGIPYVVVDLRMRMLKPRELFLAQGFPPSYIIDPIVNGKPLTLTAQTRMCGNAAPPHPVAAVVRANVEAVA